MWTFVCKTRGGGGGGGGGEENGRGREWNLNNSQLGAAN